MIACCSRTAGRFAIRALFSALALLLAACNLQGRAPDASRARATRTPTGPPAIQIASPKGGDEFVIGEEILVSVLASDSIGVNRVQLFVDNQIVRTVSSESLQGDLALQAILNYRPQRRDLGAISLRAVAYRGAVVSEPDEITVVVRESPAQVRSTPAQSGNVPFIPDDGVCRALVNVGLNFRQGPSTRYQVITVLASGTLAPITGRNSEHSWQRLSVGGQVGWVSGDYTTEYGDCGGIAVVAG
ncbi:MAG: SH3 domain-containing protein [Chloroflexi bacterium]|nr:SH3 domain-containing protein [Chloroflexota bacterium]